MLISIAVMGVRLIDVRMQGFMSVQVSDLGGGYFEPEFA